MAVALDHARDAVHERQPVARVAADVVVPAVRLDVGLVDDVQPELVARVEERRVVRVMRGAHGVEAPALHRDDVRAQVLGRDDPPGPWIEVVAVDAADEDRPPVDQQLDAAHLDPPEPDAALDPLRDAPVGRDQRHRHGPERRHLGGPRGDARDPGSQLRSPDPRRVHARLCLLPPLDVGGIGQRAGGVEAHEVQDAAARRPRHDPVAGTRRGRRRAGDGGTQRLGEALHRRLDPPARLGRIGGEAHADLELERPGDAVGVEARVDHEVREVRRPGREQEHGASDAAVPPLVLVLDERGVGPLHDRQARGRWRRAGGRP